MSYDVWLEVDLGGPYPIRVGGLDDNYTYNLSRFFTWFLGKSLSEFNGEEAERLMFAIQDGYERFSGAYDSSIMTIEELKRFEPDNGWGSVPSALAFLSRVYKACILAPNARVRVS